MLNFTQIQEFSIFEGANELFSYKYFSSTSIHENIWILRIRLIIFPRGS